MLKCNILFYDNLGQVSCTCTVLKISFKSRTFFLRRHFKLDNDAPQFENVNMMQWLNSLPYNVGHLSQFGTQNNNYFQHCNHQHALTSCHYMTGLIWKHSCAEMSNHKAFMHLIVYKWVSKKLKPTVHWLWAWGFRTVNNLIFITLKTKTSWIWFVTNCQYTITENKPF